MERRMARPFAAMLVSFLPAGEQCWSKDSLSYKPISEDAVRTASATVYSEFLATQCLKGRRYPRGQIESGFKRNFDEMRLMLVDEGYTIVPNVTECSSSWALS